MWRIVEVQRYSTTKVGSVMSMIHDGIAMFPSFKRWLFQEEYSSNSIFSRMLKNADEPILFYLQGNSQEFCKQDKKDIWALLSKESKELGSSILEIMNDHLRNEREVTSMKQVADLITMYAMQKGAYEIKQCDEEGRDFLLKDMKQQDL
jgi:hypothetical protein